MRALIGRAIRWFLDGVPARCHRITLDDAKRAAVNAELRLIGSTPPEAFLPPASSEDGLDARIRAAVQAAVDEARGALQAQIDKLKPLPARDDTPEEVADRVIEMLRPGFGNDVTDAWIADLRADMIQAVKAGCAALRGSA